MVLLLLQIVVGEQARRARLLVARKGSVMYALMPKFVLCWLFDGRAPPTGLTGAEDGALARLREENERAFGQHFLF